MAKSLGSSGCRNTTARMVKSVLLITPLRRLMPSGEPLHRLTVIGAIHWHRTVPSRTNPKRNSPCSSMMAHADRLSASHLAFRCIGGAEKEKQAFTPRWQNHASSQLGHRSSRRHNPHGRIVRGSHGRLKTCPTFLVTRQAKSEEVLDAKCPKAQMPLLYSYRWGMAHSFCLRHCTKRPTLVLE